MDALSYRADFRVKDMLKNLEGSPLEVEDGPVIRANDELSRQVRQRGQE